MIELFFVLFFIPRRVKALAALRGESWVKWSLFAIGAWFGSEIIGIFVIITILMTYAALTKSEFNQQLGLMISYFIGMAMAAMGATLVVKQLIKKPLLPNQTKDISN